MSLSLWLIVARASTSCIYILLIVLSHIASYKIFSVVIGKGFDVSYFRMFHRFLPQYFLFLLLFFFLNLNFIFLSQALVNQVTNQTHQVKVLEFCHVFYICWLLAVMAVWLFMKTLLIGRTLHSPYRLEQLDRKSY